MSAGLLSGRSRVQTPAGPPTRVFKITGKIMLAVIKDHVSVQGGWGGIYGVTRGTFFQGIEIVALTAVRATI